VAADEALALAAADEALALAAADGLPRRAELPKSQPPVKTRGAAEEEVAEASDPPH
jgi:hypothetical protein